MTAAKKYGDKAIPKFTTWGSYHVDVGWNYLEKHLTFLSESGQLELDPDFQREHVWSEEQQSRFVEFILRGGRSARDLLFNCASWHRISRSSVIQLVDGKQRLEAARKFMRGDLCIFHAGELGNPHPLYRADFLDEVFRIHRPSFSFHMNDLQTHAEVLRWYLDLNTGGVVHTAEEIERVRKLLEQEKGA